MPARSRSSGGKSHTRNATFSPIPATAQPACGRPSTRIPATLRPSTSTSFGHLIRAGEPGPRAVTTSATATPATSGSNRGGSRITIEQSSARPGAAVHVLPWRPRPADCSAAVTTVPCGAPEAASSRARALVDPITR